MSRVFETWVPVLLYTALIFTLSSIPDLSAPTDLKFSDKIIHVGEYFIWGLLLRRALHRVFPGSSLANALSTIVLGAALCYTDESFQRTVGRNYSYYDMTADVIGVSLAQIAYMFIQSRVMVGRRSEV